MTTALVPAPPRTAAEEFEVLRRGIGETQAALAQLATRRDVHPTTVQQYTQQATEYLHRATARINELRRGGFRQLPSAPMTPDQARKAGSKLSKKEKKARKREQRLKNMAHSAASSLPADSPMAQVAKELLNEGNTPDARKAALTKLVDFLPIEGPMGIAARMMAKEVLDDSEDDDD